MKIMETIIGRCNNVCLHFRYIPDDTHTYSGAYYKKSKFVCVHSAFNNRRYKHKIINRKYVACMKIPGFCPLEDYKE